MGMLLLVTHVTAQDNIAGWDAKGEKRYKKRILELKDEVWGEKLPAFNNRKVPEEYKNESAVILAKHIDLRTFDADHEIHRTFRVLIKINDKAALEKYSEFTFNQYELERGGTVLDPFDKFTTMNYIGVRIFKADGSKREIYSDEAVVTEVNRRSRKVRKLAIPDLQVGDFVEYFVRKERYVDHVNAYTEELFVLGDEEPVMEFSVHVEAWKRVFALEYMAMNGAPDFKEKIGDRTMELDLLVKNIPPQPLKLWMNAFRQVPMIRLHLCIGIRKEMDGRRKEGTIYRNPNARKVRGESKSNLSYAQRTTTKETLPFLGEVNSQIKEFKKDHPSASEEELTTYIYYLIRYMGLYRVKPGDEIFVDQRRNYSELSERHFLLYVNYLLEKNDIEADFIMVTPRYGPSQEQVFDTDDYNVMLKSIGKKPVYMSAEGVFSNPNYIPSQFEGQKAPIITSGNRNAPDVEEELPLSAADQNKQLEHYVINFNKRDPQIMEIERKTTVTGHFKTDIQKNLLLFEDYYEEERKRLGIKESFMEEFADSKKNRALADEYRNAFDKARKEAKDAFLEEVKEHFDKAPESLDNYKVLKMGLRHTEPEVAYATSFKMNGFIKKAGSNYILDAGKLIGSQMSVKPSQRERKADVHMPFARMFEYDMELVIPAGYQVEGADKLTRNVDNEWGSFIVTTSSKDGKLFIQVRKTYKNAIVPAAKWPMLLQMIDAAEEFQQQKILLKKA